MSTQARNGLLALLVIGCCIGCKPRKSSTDVQNLPFIQTNGSYLTQPNGDTLLLKGTNLGNWLVPEGYMFKLEHANAPRKIDELLYELIGPDSLQHFWHQYLNTYVTRADIQYLKKIGCNHLRLPFHYKLFTPDLYMGGRNQGFVYMDSLVSWCKAEGLYVLLDMHCAPGGQTGDNIDDSYGYPYLLKSSTSQDLLVDIWLQIATRYKNEPTVLGYDIVNEPIAHYFDADMDELNQSLYQLYTRTVEAIRTVDTRHLIFLNGSRWSTSFDVFQKPIADPNIVYEFHKYWFDVEQSEIQPYVDFREKYNVPIYIGETGENTDEWVRDFRLLLDSNAISWCFWPYKKMNNTKGIMNYEEPEPYQYITQYGLSDRSTYAKMRENRPKADTLKQIHAALRQFLHHAQYAHCFQNVGYIEALGLEPL